MKKMFKKWIVAIGIILGFIVIWTIIDTFSAFKSFAYIESVIEKNGTIIIHVDGANGDSRFHHYELIDLGNGIYELQLYASIISGDYFPIDIKIDNSKHTVKEVRQKTNTFEETDDYEIIYPSNGKRNY